MSKDLARGPESYRNEQFLSALVPELLRAKGFESVRGFKRGSMKLIEAKDAEGRSIVFWLKQGWSTVRDFSAIQFGMFDDVSDAKVLPDSYFINYVAARTASAKAHGATHALLVHMYESKIQNYVALQIDDVTNAYARQIRGWPARARNTKTPTLYFEDSRRLPEVDCITAVTALEIPLEVASGLVGADQGISGPATRKITAEVEYRLKQQRFRVEVGNRCGWRCVISGTEIREVLDAAHLPDRDWRTHNEPGDGILLRSDLHRLLDRGLAEIRQDRFWITPKARVGEYAGFHGRSVIVPSE